MKNSMPKKPSTSKGQIDMLWESCYNHIPHRLSRIELKVTMMLAFGGLSLALLSIVLAIVRN